MVLLQSEHTKTHINSWTDINNSVNIPLLQPHIYWAEVGKGPRKQSRSTPRLSS